MRTDLQSARELLENVNARLKIRGLPTGHKSLPVVRRYIREGSLFRENTATKLGL